MERTTNDLLKEMDAISRMITELESSLGIARERGKELFCEFQKRQGDLGAAFGIEAAKGRRRGSREPRPLAARIMVSVTRLLNELSAEGASVKDARAQALATALKVAKKNGASAVPQEAVARIEERLKGFGKAK